MSAENYKIDSYASTYIDKYYEPKSPLDLTIIRFLVFSVVIYKLFSRDFSFFGTIPESVFSFYPIFIYPPFNYIIMAGFPPFFELGTFHWIHWIVPFPSEYIFKILQYFCILMCAITMFFGRGPKNIYAIICFVLLSYLWGFIYRTGQDIDAFFLTMGCLFVYVFSTHPEKPLHRVKELSKAPKDKLSGWTYSSYLMVFVLYYFTAGINKIIDLSFADWFNYDLVENINYMVDLTKAGAMSYVPEFFTVTLYMPWLNYVGPPLVYICHLTAPMMFFYRSHLAKFFIFYFIFHFMTIGVGIMFFANFMMWAIFVPYHKIFLQSFRNQNH